MRECVYERWRANSVQSHTDPFRACGPETLVPYAKMNRITMVRKQMCFMTTVKVLDTRNARDLWLQSRLK